jgi:hypothetical protein
MENKPMTEREKADITMRAIALQDEGKKEEAYNLLKTIPVPAYLVKILKEQFGIDYLITGGWNLSEAEAVYGRDWLAS